MRPMVPHLGQPGARPQLRSDVQLSYRPIADRLVRSPHYVGTYARATIEDPLDLALSRRAAPAANIIDDHSRGLRRLHCFRSIRSRDDIARRDREQPES